MIDEEATKERYGYYSTDLKPKSSKKILAICDECAKKRVLPNHSYRALCLSCSRKKNKNPNWKGGKVKCVCIQCGKVRECNKSNCRTLCISCVKKGAKHWNYGKKNSEATRKKISAALKGKMGEDSSHWKGGKIKRICRTCGKEFEVKQYLIKKGGGKYCSLSCLAKARMRNAKPHKTKPERIFENICKRKDLPYYYVGDGQLWIGKRGRKQLNPDFVEVNGKKICVEIMGRYWHSPLLNRNLSLESQQGYRKKHYNRYKWHPIFIWDTDLERKDAEAFVFKILERV